MRPILFLHVVFHGDLDRLFKDNPFMFSRETWMDSLNDNGVQWYKEWSNGREMYEGK